MNGARLDVRACKRARGFTLIEMLIVLAIIMVLAVVALTSQSSFNRSFLLTNTAYDIALTVRGAQNYGVGGHTIAASNVGYGVDFQMTAPRSFLLFADTYPDVSSAPLCHPVAGGPTQPGAQPGDCRYTAGSDVQAAAYDIGNGISIEDLCIDVLSGGSDSWQCASSGGFSQLDIVFARPNATTFMAAGTQGQTNWVYSANNALNTSSSAVLKACIKLTSSSGGLKVVEVNAAGEITANGNSCI